MTFLRCSVKAWILITSGFLTGEVVYSSSDLTELNNLSRGWDGTYKGKLQDPCTFAYLIKATDEAGNKIDKKGNMI
jgi:hypothetical protein